MILYEIHTFRNAKWKIDSVFDDRELAVYEAQRIEKGGRFAAVRVIQETHDEETQRTSTRVVYRTSKVDAANIEAVRRRVQPLAVSTPPPRRRKRRGVSTLTLMLTLIAIVLGGIGALFLLRDFSDRF